MTEEEIAAQKAKDDEAAKAADKGNTGNGGAGDAEEETFTMTKAEREAFALSEGDRRTKQAEPKLREKFINEYKAELAKEKETDEAKKRGEYDKIIDDLKANDATKDAKIGKLLPIIERQLTARLKEIPESLARLIPKGMDADDMMNYIDGEDFQAALTDYADKTAAPKNAGGAGVNAFKPTNGSKELTEAQLKAMSAAQMKALSKEDSDHYADKYGYGVFEK